MFPQRSRGAGRPDRPKGKHAAAKDIPRVCGAGVLCLNWPDLGFFLKAVEDLATPAQLGRTLAKLRDGLGLDTAAQEEYPNVIEGFPSVGCSDSVNPTRFAAWPNDAEAAERQFGYFGRIWTWASSVCAPWPKTAGQDRYLGPWNARTSSPVLMVGNHFDPATRYQGAARYLVTTRVPPAGTVCRPLGSPFDSAMLAAKARAVVLGVPARPLPFDDHDLADLHRHRAALTTDPLPTVAVARSGVSCRGLQAAYGPDDLLCAWRT